MGWSGRPAGSQRGVLPSAGSPGPAAAVGTGPGRAGRWRRTVCPPASPRRVAHRASRRAFGRPASRGWRRGLLVRSLLGLPQGTAGTCTQQAPVHSTVQPGPGAPHRPRTLTTTSPPSSWMQSELLKNLPPPAGRCVPLVSRAPAGAGTATDSSPAPYPAAPCTPRWAAPRRSPAGCPEQGPPAGCPCLRSAESVLQKPCGVSRGQARAAHDGAAIRRCRMWDLAQVLQAGDGKAFCALRPAQHVRSSMQKFVCAHLLRSCSLTSSPPFQPAWCSSVSHCTCIHGGCSRRAALRWQARRPQGPLCGRGALAQGRPRLHAWPCRGQLEGGGGWALAANRRCLPRAPRTPPGPPTQPDAQARPFTDCRGRGQHPAALERHAAGGRLHARLGGLAGVGAQGGRPARAAGGPGGGAAGHGGAGSAAAGQAPAGAWVACWRWRHAFIACSCRRRCTRLPGHPRRTPCRSGFLPRRSRWWRSGLWRAESWTSVSRSGYWPRR